MAGDDNFLARWSRRKSESKEAAPEPLQESGADAAVRESVAPLPAAPDRAPLPPVESLTPDSDFAPFMAADVDGGVRRQALKTLFSDPRFNTMDMMDVYVDDYSKPDPIPESWMGKLEQLSRLGDRAGRDREEAERRKALAEAQAAGTDPPAGEPPQAAVPAEPAPRLADEGAPAEPVPPPPIPVLPSGESGT